MKKALKTVLCVAILSGCSTTQVAPLPPMPEAPKYVQVPHPEGLEQGDLLAIFTESGAPSPEAMVGCESDYSKLRKATSSKDELQDGARELIRRDSVKAHWCFYSVLLNLDRKLKETPYVDERQKSVLEAYAYLTPMARAFKLEFQDTRYLRWAVSRYQKLSEYVFYRRLEPTPQTSAEITGASTPFGASRSPVVEPRAVLDKYGLAAPGPSFPAPSASGSLPSAASAPGSGSREGAAASAQQAQGDQFPAVVPDASQAQATTATGDLPGAPDTTGATDPTDSTDPTGSDRAPAASN